MNSLIFLNSSAFFRNFLTILKLPFSGKKKFTNLFNTKLDIRVFEKKFETDSVIVREVTRNILECNVESCYKNVSKIVKN